MARKQDGVHRSGARSDSRETRPVAARQGRSGESVATPCAVTADLDALEPDGHTTTRIPQSRSIGYCSPATGAVHLRPAVVHEPTGGTANRRMYLVQRQMRYGESSSRTPCLAQGVEAAKSATGLSDQKLARWRFEFD
jgi:hypothetical protein